MSADLHLVAFDPNVIPVDVLRSYLSFDYNDYPTDEELLAAEERNSAYGEQIYGGEYKFLDSVWVGQVSWSKAYFLGDADDVNRYVPKSVMSISEFYETRGHVVQITEKVIPALTLAFNLKSDSIYENTRDERGGRLPKRKLYRGVNDARSVKKFLQRNIGNYTFAPSW